MSEKDSNTKPELLPCPFCGRLSKVQPIDDGRFYFVSAKHKKKCYLFDEQPTYYYSANQHQLISEWNRRA